jgi:hypothetical protein
MRSTGNHGELGEVEDAFSSLGTSGPGIGLPKDASPLRRCGSTRRPMIGSRAAPGHCVTGGEALGNDHCQAHPGTKRCVGRGGMP